MGGDSVPADIPRSSFVVVANRLPVDRVDDGDGPSYRRSPGGLVSALAPVLRSHSGVWVGWPGGEDDETEPFETDGMSLVPVALSGEDLAFFYEGMCNATIWPLYHDLVATPEFHRDWWERYVEVNKRFAESALAAVADDGVVWVHDYQLQLVPQLIREQRPDVKIGFFLHIPFPPAELFRQLPWRDHILRGLLGADLIGFQRPGGAANFTRLVRDRLRLKTHRATIETPDGRTVRASAFPISIDTTELDRLVRDPDVVARADEIRQEVGRPETVFLGVDRLDYTKGIEPRLRAFGELVADGRLSVDEAVFIQVATPSRERVDEYRRVREELDQLVGRINSQHGRIGKAPIRYLHHSYPREEMAALFLAGDVMVTTPYVDGMNLVAKEYVTCRIHDSGALVLSEFAGASAELRQAYLVNPYDINGLKETLLTAKSATPAEKRRRMRALRRQVREHDIEHWAKSFLDALGVGS
jgi:trehalose 6-phosphate synthase